MGDAQVKGSVAAPGDARVVQTHAGPATLIREWWPTSDLDPHRWFLVQYPDGRRKLVGGAEIVAATAGLKEEP